MGKRKRNTQDRVDEDDIHEIGRPEETLEENGKALKKKNKRDKLKNIITGDTSADHDNDKTVVKDSNTRKVKKESKKLDPTTLDQDDNQKEESVETSKSSKVKKNKKKQSLREDDDQNLEATTETIAEVIKKKKSKKIKPITESVESESSSTEKTAEVKDKTESLKASKGKTKQSTSNISTSAVKNKKIIFDDDDEPQTSDSSKEKGNKSKSFLNEDEADVKDEDIDRFCDELGEDDNLQYENWVKLIEDKLHSNTKSGKKGK